MNEVSGIVAAEVKRYFKQRQYQSLSGIGHYHDVNEPLPNTEGDCTKEDCLGWNPLQMLQAELYYNLAEVKYYLESHNHEWDENGFCECGWDGNA